MKKQARLSAIAIAKKFPIEYVPSERLGRAARLNAAEISLLSWRNLWQMLLFLLISIVAFACQDFDLFAFLPETLWPLFGAPPPPELIHPLLFVYTFCALMLLPARLRTASQYQSWVHTGYRTVFYLFYLTASTLAAHFLAVFAAGLLLYLAEQFYLFLCRVKALEGRGRIAEHNK